ncbi:MAG: protein-ADP-ribose hydrolase [Clostridia bacterium]|nr:protein-ADP-ribose hydrolase [Clostridia bacterium]
MTRSEQLAFLIHALAPDSCIPASDAEKWRLLRALVNVREPGAVSEAFLAVQDAFLQGEIAAKGITDIEDLQPVRDNLYLWQGDITTLRADAIVNAANSGMTGCYCPNHGCIDNVIHTFAGVQLRNECAQRMQQQGYPEPTGQAKLTAAYNLPCRYILHTVGPIVQGGLTERHKAELANCYRSCLTLAAETGLSAIAFCCISTGVFHFPNAIAAQIAVDTVEAFQREHPSMRVIFNVFLNKDLEIYREVLR